MKRFLFNSIIFIAINLGIAGGYLYLNQNWYEYNNWNTYSSLLPMRDNQKYDLLILGSSHARVFSSFGNHERVENILGVKMLNLSKTASGLLPQKALLEYFYERGNSTSKILYILDPQIFYSAKWNEDNYFLEDEPLYLGFLWCALREGISYEVLTNYVRSKFSFYWLSSRAPVVELYEDTALSRIDKEAVRKRKEFLYSDGLKKEIFEHYARMMKELVLSAQKHNTKIVFIYPPTLLGDLSGSKEVADLVESFKDSGVHFYDFSNVLKEHNYYQDHDHLNTSGVELFVGKYLASRLRVKV